MRLKMGSRIAVFLGEPHEEGKLETESPESESGGDGGELLNTSSR
jgi:hypothetical protein